MYSKSGCRIFITYAFHIHKKNTLQVVVKYLKGAYFSLISSPLKLVISRITQQQQQQLNQQ